MCGLVGGAGNIQKEDREMFKQLLIIDAIRGPHSTGVATANAVRDLSVFKKALCPVDFLQLDGYGQTVRGDSQVIIGHNRFATVGRINNITAHPFEQGDIIGAHNGTLINWYRLPDARDFDVDSECLIYNISEHGWDKTMPKVQGAFALTVYDAFEHRLQVMRNAERPLWIAEKEDGSVVYWASEAWMLKGVANRCQVKLKKNIWQPKENTLCTWDLPDKKEGKLSKVRFRLLEPEVKKYNPPVTYDRAGGSSWATIKGPGGKGPVRQGNHTYPTQIELARDMGVSLHTRVEFMPCGEEASDFTNRMYLTGCITSDPWTDVRVYLEEDEVKTYLDAGEVVSGDIQSLIPSSWDRGVETEPYILLKSRSLKPEGVLDTDTITAKGTVPGTNFGGDITTLILGPDGKMITEKEFFIRTKDGCSLCSKDLDADITFWEKSDAFCRGCYDDYNKGKHL